MLVLIPLVGLGNDFHRINSLLHSLVAHGAFHDRAREGLLHQFFALFGLLANIGREPLVILLHLFVDDIGNDITQHELRNRLFFPHHPGVRSNSGLKVEVGVVRPEKLWR